jgi:glycerophosphoryl diester phosphodiesterase
MSRTGGRALSEGFDDDAGGVLLLGHRGAAGPAYPENTLAAVERALQLGADGVEVDVRLTADGVPVVHHDEDLRRTAGVHRSVVALARSELPRVCGHRIPSLDEVLDLVADRGRVVVEMKTPQWPDGAKVDTVDAVVAVLRRHRLHDVVVSSFDRPRALELRRCRTGVRTALLSRPGVPFGVALRRALADGHDEVHPHVDAVLRRRDLLEVASRLGISVTPWTVNRMHDLLLLAEAEVPAVVCDQPGAARKALRSGCLAAAG